MRRSTRFIMLAALFVAASGCGGGSGDSAGAQDATPTTTLTVKSPKGWDYSVDVNSLKLSFEPTQPGFSELRVHGKAKITNKAELPSPDANLMFAIVGLYDMSLVPSQAGTTSDGQSLFAARSACQSGLPVMFPQTVGGKEYCIVTLGLIRGVQLDGGASDEFEFSETSSVTVRDADTPAVTAYLSKPPFWMLTHSEGFETVPGQPVKA